MHTPPHPNNALKQAILNNPHSVLDDADIMHALLNAHKIHPENVDTTIPQARNVVDLRSALVNNLETRLQTLTHKHQNVISVVHTNMIAIQHAHTAAINLIHSTNLHSLLVILNNNVSKDLTTHIIRLVIECQTPDIKLQTLIDKGLLVHVPIGFIDRYPFNNPTTKANDKKRFVLRSIGRLPTNPDIYKHNNAKIKSEAVVTLRPFPQSHGIVRAALVFGSTDKNKFNPEYNADLLIFLCDVVHGLLIHHLNTATQNVQPLHEQHSEQHSRTP